MGRTYKDMYESLPKRIAVNKRTAKKAQIRETVKKNKGESPYNNLESEEYEEDNFEKFSRKR